MSQVMGEVTPLWQWIIQQPLEYARSTSSGALLLGAVVLEPVVVLVSLPCRSWSALKMEDMQSGLRFDGKPRGRRRTPPSHDWIFVPRPCRRASHTGSQAFAHAADEVPETRSILVIWDFGGHSGRAHAPALHCWGVQPVDEASARVESRPRIASH